MVCSVCLQFRFLYIFKVQTKESPICLCFLFKLMFHTYSVCLPLELFSKSKPKSPLYAYVPISSCVKNSTRKLYTKYKALYFPYHSIQCKEFHSQIIYLSIKHCISHTIASCVKNSTRKLYTKYKALYFHAIVSCVKYEPKVYQVQNAYINGGDPPRCRGKVLVPETKGPRFEPQWWQRFSIRATVVAAW